MSVFIKQKGAEISLNLLCDKHIGFEHLCTNIFRWCIFISLFSQESAEFYYRGAEKPTQVRATEVCGPVY